MRCFGIVARSVFALGLIAGIAVADEAADETPPGTLRSGVERPTIALVLSGGGAKGLAHVGVLRVLEEMQVPVDIVVGTSAGSAVAALYAMGMPVMEIENRFDAMDWSVGFVDEYSREDRSFRRKQEDRQMAGFGLGLGLDGIKLRRGVVEGQELQLVLNDLTALAESVPDFDRLPLRYRAIAADLTTGETVAIGKGSVARAIRASMSIPMVYSPVEIDGRLLVDGGLAANLPIDVARTLGADVIIAVDISTPLSKKAALTDALAIGDQMTNMLTRRNVEQQITTLTPDDVLIVPDLEGAGTADFERSDELVEIGATAARNAALKLHRLAVSDEDWLAYEKKRQPPVPEVRRIARIEVKNDSHVSDEFLLSRIRLKQGTPFDRRILEKNIRDIYGLGYFESVLYEVMQEDAEVVVRIIAREKSWGPNYLRVGLAIEDNFEGDNFFNLAVGYNVTGLNSYGAEWDTRATIGDDPFIETEFYQPLSFSWRYFVAAELGYHNRDLNDYAASGRVAEHAIDYRYARFSLGKELGSVAEIRAYIERGKLDDLIEFGAGVGASWDIHTGLVGMGFRYDTQDQIDMPGQGLFVALDAQSSHPELGADQRYDNLAGVFSQAASYGKYTLLGRLAASKRLAGDLPFANEVRLGGFMRLSGYARDQFSGHDAALGSLALYRRFGSALFPYYVGAAYEVGNVWEHLEDARLEDTLDTVSLFMAIDTPLGLLNLAWSHADGANQALYLSLGMGFREIF